MKFAFILIFLLCAQIGVFGQTANGIEPADVRSTLVKYDEAWNRKDAKTVGEVLDERYIYFSSVGSLTDRKSSLEFLAKPDYKLTSVSRTEVKLHSYDGRTAVISSRWQGKGSWSGGEIDDDQRCGQVFVKRGKVWKLLSENCAQIVTK